MRTELAPKTGAGSPRSERLCLHDNLGITIASVHRPGSKPPIIFAHGNASDRSIWSSLSASLSDHEQLLIDLRGHGDSGWTSPPAYATADYASDIATVARHLEGSEYMLVGHGNGGLAALYLAAFLEPKPAALVVIDIEGRIPDEQVEYYRQRAAAVAWPGSLERIVTEMLQVDPRVPVATMRDHVRGVVRWVDYGFCLNLDPATYASWRPENLEPHLGSITCPVMIARGADSQVTTEEGAERLRKGLSRSRLIAVDNAGHFLPISHAWELAGLIGLMADEFLPQRPPTSSSLRDQPAR
jgi:pimeloyl-ACP methyl ester carboxylesterase